MGAYLIISHTARALAESAKRDSCSVHCLDYFSDEDTKAVSESVNHLNNVFGGFDKEELIETVRDYVNENPSIVIVVGSGFEKNPEQLNSLGEITRVVSNSPETLSKIINPDRFKNVLVKNAIKFPCTSLVTPSDTSQYLIKEVGGVGGMQVQWVKDCDDINKPGYYFQEYISGQVLSAVFLASENQIHVVGFNVQLQTDQFSETPFLYQGAITLKSLENDIQEQVLDIIYKISKETGLRGLCGIDFILDENNDIYVLEVNPRPPATFELHENNHSLFKYHLSCFESNPLVYENSNDESVKGYLILYARQDININTEISWPEWIKDRPILGRHISYHEPVCSIHAEAESMDATKVLLNKRLDKIESKILNMQNAA